jgi:LPS export ABC transporter protein LptC
MNRWQRRARLVVAVFGVLFAAFVARELKRRTPPSPQAPLVDIAPGAVIEGLKGALENVIGSNQKYRLNYEKSVTFSDGTMKLTTVHIVSAEKNGKDSFEATGKEAIVAQDQTSVVLNGDVKLTSADVHARTEHATYTKADNTVRVPGPVEIAEGRTTATGIGMIFDRDRDVMTILDQAVVKIAPDKSGADASDITSGTAVFARREKMRRFERNVRMLRGDQVILAETAIAKLSEDESHVESIELHGGARITSSKAAVGGLQALTAGDVTLKYTADGTSLEHAMLLGEASVQVAGEAGQPGRQITSNVMDVALAADGTTPTALIARESVQLVIPPEPNVPGRTIRSTNLDAKGEAGRGLTRAVFSGNVQFRERGGSVDRAAASASLDVGLKPGLSAIEDARFSRGVRFEEGKMLATAAAARYDVDKGTLALSGSEPGALAPHVVNEQISVDAKTVDVTLAGPLVKATGDVKSQLQPPKKGAKPGEGNDVKLPAMLKQDQPVNVVAGTLDYDGMKARGSYTGVARLWQGETSIKGDTIVIDDKTGDLTATGSVTTTSILEPKDKDKEKDKKPADRQPSTARAKQLKYDDAARRLTYTGDAHMTGPEGDMMASKIELYLKPSGDELDRAEAYENLTLREQNRKTTGGRLTYTTTDEKYVVTGAPVTIVDQCERTTKGKTLTFLKATDSIVIDGDQRYRTETKGGSKCPG